MTSDWRSHLHPDGLDGLRQHELELGKVIGVFGVRGEVRLFLHIRESTLLVKGPIGILIDSTGRRFKARVWSRSGAGGRVIGRIEGVDSREKAEAMRDVVLALPMEALPEPDEDEYYLQEAVGMAVRCGEDPLGVVVRVHTTGPIEVFELDSGAYLPSTREHILSIDRTARVIEVREGAIEV